MRRRAVAEGDEPGQIVVRPLQVGSVEAAHARIRDRRH